MTLNLTPRKFLQFRPPLEVFPGQSHLALYWFEVCKQGFEERVVPSGALEFAFHGSL